MAGNERTNVKVFPTALATDVLFYVLVDETLPKNKAPEYGTSYRECLPHAAPDYPHHKLVFISAADASGLQKWYFAADRENQDDYNWNIAQGSELVREYVIPRNLYYGRTEAEAGTNKVRGEFFSPVAATPDTRFAKYGFADDTLVDAPQELRSRYVVIQRRFIEPITIDYPYNDTLERNITVTKEVISPDEGQPPTTSVPGSIVEVQHANSFHDVRITKAIDGSDGEIYYEITPVPSTYNRPFPRMLKSVELRWVNAWAYAAGQQPAYAEDYYFEFKIDDARPGPYEATIRRFITNDPASVKADYPIVIIPQPASESIGILGWWWHASTETGNSAFASAKEYVVPSTIHAEVTVDFNQFLPNGTDSVLINTDHGYTTTLPATTGLTTFLETLATGLVTVDYDVRPAPLGLYQVDVIQVDLTNLYS